MTENIVKCNKCANLYFNISNGGYYCGAYVEGKEGIHIVKSYKTASGKYIDVFDCEEYAEQCQLKFDTRIFKEQKNDD